MATTTHCVLSFVSTDEEDKLSDEQVGPQVAVDGAVVCVPGRPLAAQGGKAGGQTHQSHRDTNPGNHIDEKLLHPDSELRRRRRREHRLGTVKSVHACSVVCGVQRCCVSASGCLAVCVSYITAI